MISHETLEFLLFTDDLGRCTWILIESRISHLRPQFVEAALERNDVW
jgi:hypothetical protein